MNFNLAQRLKKKRFLIPQNYENLPWYFLLDTITAITILSPATADNEFTVESFCACGSLTTLRNIKND